MKNISNLFKEHRINKGLKKKEVSKQLKFSEQFYGRIENGFIELPPEYYKKIIKVLNISEKHFVDAMIADFRKHLDKYL